MEDGQCGRQSEHSLAKTNGLERFGMAGKSRRMLRKIVRRMKRQRSAQSKITAPRRIGSVIQLSRSLWGLCLALPMEAIAGRKPQMAS